MCVWIYVGGWEREREHGRCSSSKKLYAQNQREKEGEERTVQSQIFQHSPPPPLPFPPEKSSPIFLIRHNSLLLFLPRPSYAAPSAVEGSERRRRRAGVAEGGGERRRGGRKTGDIITSSLCQCMIFISGGGGGRASAASDWGRGENMEYEWWGVGREGGRRRRRREKAAAAET